MKSIKINIIGKVQGVGFRYFVREKAKLLNIKGFVRNEYVRSVYIEAEGNNENIETFISYCKKGPARSNVEKFIINENYLMNYEKFVVKY